MSNSAKTCRENGWTVGTRLSGKEYDSTSVIEITAIGETGILAKELTRNGKIVEDVREAGWVFTCRDWVRVGQNPDIEASQYAALQSLVVEYLAAKREWEVNQERFRDVCNGPHNPPLHNQVHDLVYKSFDAMEAAEQALRAAVPN